MRAGVFTGPHGAKPARTRHVQRNWLARRARPSLAAVRGAAMAVRPEALNAGAGKCRHGRRKAGNAGERGGQTQLQVAKSALVNRVRRYMIMPLGIFACNMASPPRQKRSYGNGRGPGPGPGGRKRMQPSDSETHTRRGIATRRPSCSRGAHSPSGPYWPSGLGVNTEPDNAATRWRPSASSAEASAFPHLAQRSLCPVLHHSPCSRRGSRT